MLELFLKDMDVTAGKERERFLSFPTIYEQIFLWNFAQTAQDLGDLIRGSEIEM